MMLTDTVPVLRPPVRGKEELPATGRFVTRRECLKRSHAHRAAVRYAAAIISCRSITGRRSLLLPVPLPRKPGRALRVGALTA